MPMKWSRFATLSWMHAALEQFGVPVKLVRIEGGGHGPDFPGATSPPDYLGEMVHWFNAHLPAASMATPAT
jgi:dipeptidyl aminopeptidase/acylaminoacyl peptidase